MGHRRRSFVTDVRRPTKDVACHRHKESKKQCDRVIITVISVQCVQYPAFALGLQKNEELLNALPVSRVSRNGTSSLLSSSGKTSSRWKVFRRFLCMSAPSKQAASSIRRSGTAMRSSSLMASSPGTKYSALDMQSENYEGWISSAQEDAHVGLTCTHSADLSIGISFQEPSHKSSGSSSSSHCLSFVSAPSSHELKLERAVSMQYRSIRN